MYRLLRIFLIELGSASRDGVSRIDHKVFFIKKWINAMFSYMNLT